MNTQERIAELEAENAALRAQVGEVAALREQVALLTAQVQTLQNRLSLDSHNSGNPPSSDGLARKTGSLRRPSGKRQGGQLGHRGETRHLVGPGQADTVVAHRPTVCATCQALLDERAPVMGGERRHVHDLPPTRLHITEHQALPVRCPSCQQVTTAAFPDDAPSRAQSGRHLRAWVVYLVTQQCVPYARVRDLLAEGYGIHRSVGTLVTWIQQRAQALTPVEATLKGALRQAPVLHSDETGVRRAGHLAWAHVTSTPQQTH